jgi:hypothetical protein
VCASTTCRPALTVPCVAKVGGAWGFKGWGWVNGCSTASPTPVPQTFTHITHPPLLEEFSLNLPQLGKEGCPAEEGGGADARQTMYLSHEIESVCLIDGNPVLSAGLTPQSSSQLHLECRPLASQHLISSVFHSPTSWLPPPAQVLPP